MSKAKPKYYWDSNLFLALLKNEQRKTGEMEGLNEIVWMVDHGQANIVTSVVSPCILATVSISKFLGSSIEPYILFCNAFTVSM